MSEMNVRTCPNCGANVHGTICQYCGAVDDRIFQVEPGTPVMLSYMLGNQRITFQLSVSQLYLFPNTDTVHLYADDGVYTSFTNIEGYNVVLDGHMVPFEHESLSPGKTAYYIVEVVS